MSARAGNKTAVLDADITGPSIPTAFGITERPQSDGTGIIPVYTKTGIATMSLNLLLANATDPVVWRGPVIGGTVKQFWTDVIWGDIDYMFIDMPPGTGDVALTVFQSIPVDALVIVTSPQELVGMIVSKCVKMAEMMEIPVIGLVENMSYFKCPDCGGEHRIFGDSHVDQIAAEHNVKTVSRIPIDPALAAKCDAGEIESFEGDWLDNLMDAIKAL
jgi:Mrp family chromosome partitioning ATPase